MLVSPIEAELRYFAALAYELGARDRAGFVLTTAERWPFRERSIDVVISAGSLHHVDVAHAMPLIAHSLSLDGIVLSWDIFDSPIYRAAIGVAGKHENVACTPLTSEDIDVATRLFADARVRYTGVLFRYPLGVLRRLAITPPARLALMLLRADRWIAGKIPSLKLSASIVDLQLAAPRQNLEAAYQAPPNS